jgi:DNA polymerase-3 subunit epsilon
MTGISDYNVLGKPTFKEVSDIIYGFFNGKNSSEIVFVGHNAKFDYSFLLESFRRCDYDFNFKSLCTCKLSRRLFHNLKSKSLSSVSDFLKIINLSKHRAKGDAFATAKILLKMLEILQNEYGIEYIDELLSLQNAKLDSDKLKAKLKKIRLDINEIPRTPGVYLMKNRNGKIIYIGKSKNLRDRVSSYFRMNSYEIDKNRNLLKSINEVEYFETQSELSALILESRLIKEHKPRYNKAIKRHTLHSFIKINSSNNFPVIHKAYDIYKDDSFYLGPFSSGFTVNFILELIKEKYRLRKCDEVQFKKSKGCIYYEMNQCYSPCSGKINQKDYNKLMENVKDFLSGNDGDDNLIYYLTKIMYEHSAKLEFETASELKEVLYDLQRVHKYQNVINSLLNGNKILIKFRNRLSYEYHYINQGKLLKSYMSNNDTSVEDLNILQEIYDDVTSLFIASEFNFKERYNKTEIDEIKVISNWLAVNYGKYKYKEISEEISFNEVINFLQK